MDQSQLYTTRLVRSMRAFIRDRFNLHEDQAAEQQTIDEIEHSVVFRGANLWILIFAIMVASVGLNVNSTAVIIGAMLISPLMGPIMGVGLGVGINDHQLIIKALRNLGIAVGISVLTSALYFWISPLNDAQSELLARTTPTLWDVLIALFGGLAGIVAGSRREKSNAIPGVAIATALMPPLCTAGYGLATAQWSYLAGAFYLFFINSVFISLSTYLIVRLLRFRPKEYVDPRRERRIKRYIGFFILLTIVPSIYTAYTVVRTSIFERRVQQYVQSEMQFDNTKILDSHIIESDSLQILDITLYGEPVADNLIAQARSQLSNYGLEGVELRVRQGHTADESPDIDLEALNAQMKTGIIEDLYKRNEELLETKDEQIKVLEQEIVRMRGRQLPVAEMSREVRAINERVTSFSVDETILCNLQDSLSMDTVYVAYVQFSKAPKRAERRQISDWLKARLGSEEVKLLVE